MTFVRTATRAALALAGVVWGASMVQAQPPVQADRVPMSTAPLSMQTLIQTETTPSTTRGRRAVEPLPAGIEYRLLRALDLRASGLPDRARDTLVVLLRQQPHHPLIVTELGRTHAVREDWASLERLAVAERTASRDSALLAPELSVAYERLAKPREALKVAVTAWAASPLDAAWAMPQVWKLAAVDPRLAQHSLEEAVKLRPWRSDLAIGLARLHALAGRPADAVRVLRESEQRSGRSGLRVMFTDESLRSTRPADSTAAIAALLDLAADGSRRPEERLSAGRRVWYLALATGREAEVAVPLAAGMRDVPGEQWGPELLLGVVRTLQTSGRVTEAKALLSANPGLEQRMPELVMERALASAREGDLAGAIPVLDSLAGSWPAARYMLAELQFFAAQADSAHANYERVS